MVPNPMIFPLFLFLILCLLSVYINKKQTLLNRFWFPSSSLLLFIIYNSYPSPLSISISNYHYPPSISSSSPFSNYPPFSSSFPLQTKQHTNKWIKITNYLNYCCCHWLLTVDPQNQQHTYNTCGSVFDLDWSAVDLLTVHLLHPNPPPIHQQHTWIAAAADSGAANSMNPNPLWVPVALSMIIRQ